MLAKFSIKGNSIPVNAYMFIEDISSVYSTLEITTPTVITDELTVETAVRQKYRVMRSSYENQMYHYVLVTSEIYEALNHKSAAFTGSCNVRTLLQKIGVRTSIKEQTQDNYWIVPRSMLVTVLNILNDFGSVTLGKAPFFQVELDGTVSVIDLKKCFDKNAISIKADVLEDNAALDWSIRVPGIYSVNAYRSDGNSIKTYNDLDLGAGSVWINDTTHYGTSAYKTKMSNMFWKRFYTARTLTARVVDSVPIGSLVTINSGFQKFVVTGRTVSCLNNEDATPVIQLRLSAPWRQ